MLRHCRRSPFFFVASLLACVCVRDLFSFAFFSFSSISSPPPPPPFPPIAGVFMVVMLVMPSLGSLLSVSASDEPELHRAYNTPGSGGAGHHHAAGHLVAQRQHPDGGAEGAEGGAAAPPQGLSPLSTLIPAALLLMAMQCSLVLSFTSTFVMINNSCRRMDRGTGNGIGQTFASLGRSIGPAIAGSLFAWSQAAPRSWPFDYHFVFVMIVLASAGIISLSMRLPSKVNKKVYDD